MIPPTILLSVLFIITSLYIYYINLQKRIHKLPPGPSRLPILGNIFNAPTQYGWKQYAKWGQEFNSDIIYLNLLGMHLVVLNTREAAYELLERRSRIYSSRPHSHMAMDLMGYAWNFALMPYNNLWRASRRLVARYFLRLPTTSTSTDEDDDIPSQTQQQWYQPQIQVQTLILLQNIIRSPKSFLSHVSKQIGAISLSTTFNLPISATDKDDDEYIRISNRAVDNLKFAMVPGRFLVDMFPILMYAPSWVKFKRLAKGWKNDTQLSFEKPFRDAKKRWELGKDTDTVSFVTEALNTIVPDSEEEELLKAVSSTLFSATIGTTSAVMHTFILAMVLHPEIQGRAQAELDAVLVESGEAIRRIPRVEDAEKVPICMAVIYESFRWQCVAPIALPHLTTEDDVYNGYHIPKGATILANVWAMSNDENLYPNPSDFNPDRFLTDTGSLNECLVKQLLDDTFGFGRRKCIGKPLALAILSHTCLSLLSCFHMCKAVDENGNIIEPKVEYESAVTSGPYPFECDFKAREGVRQFLQQKR